MGPRFHRQDRACGRGRNGLKPDLQAERFPERSVCAGLPSLAFGTETFRHDGVEVPGDALLPGLGQKGRTSMCRAWSDTRRVRGNSEVGLNSLKSSRVSSRTSPSSSISDAGCAVGLLCAGVGLPHRDDAMCFSRNLSPGQTPAPGSRISCNRPAAARAKVRNTTLRRAPDKGVSGAIRTTSAS